MTDKIADREMSWVAAKAEARKAIYDTGRGMIGRERNYLEDRVARAILAAEQRALDAKDKRIAELEAALVRLRWAPVVTAELVRDVVNATFPSRLLNKEDRNG